MDTVYCALVRWGPEWDGQSIYYTNSKAMFDQLYLADHTYGSDKPIYFDTFSDELKAQLRAVRAAFVTQHPDIALDSEDDMSISEAMEWLECSPKFPVVLAGEAELTASWNW